MKILVICEPGIYGAFRIVEWLVHYLIEQKQEVHLAYSDRRDSEDLQKLVAFVRKSGGRCLNLGVGNAPECRDLPALYRLWALAREIRPTVIHAHSAKAGVLGRLLWCLGIRAKFFYTPHAYYGLAPRPGLMPLFFNAMEQLLGGIGTTITYSEDDQRFGLESIGVPPDQMRLIRNPLDGEVFHPACAEERRAAREKFGLPQDAIVLGMIGRLTFQKDPLALYHALAPVLVENPRVMLFHVGSGELDEEVAVAARGLGSQVVRCGFLDSPAVFYHAVDGVALTARYEAAWALVLLEAMASGLPLIVTSAPGLSDIGDAGLSHCWAVPRGQSARLTDAIKAWADDLPRHRANNHRQFVLARHSIESTFGVLLATYWSATASSIATRLAEYA